MNAGAKVCQNCKNQFVIEPEDFAFYEKMQVPPPTFCPLCRAERRFVWRNEHFLYKRKSDSTGNIIFSAFSMESKTKVFEKEIWWEDGWDPLEYGMAVDFSRPFLDQIRALNELVPKPSLFVVQMSGSEYCNNATGAKNCYLVFNTNYAEDCMYGNGVDRSRDCIDISHLTECELCYEGFWLTRCSRAFFSSQCEDCVDIHFSKNLRGCTNCFGCINLRNKSYHIFNEPYSKDAYFEKLKTFNLGSFAAIERLKKEVQSRHLRVPHKFMEGVQNADVTGEYVTHSKNVRNSYLVREGEDLRYCQYLQTPPNKNCYDHSIWGNNNQFTYECSACGLGTNNIKFCALCWPDVRELQYCLFCGSSSYLFGCVGLRKKQYCILNKQYTKDEYEKLVSRIVDHMNVMPYTDSKGRTYRYGEFFPVELSPYAYNETIAQEHFPISKEESLDEGYQWRDSEDRQYKITVQPESIPDHSKDVSDAITSDVIGCTHKAKCNDQCTTAFKITAQELQFYHKMNLPLPRLCPNCRHYQRLRQRNSIRSYRRTCACAGADSKNRAYKNMVKHFHGEAPCPNEFETSYAPDRPEIVYCEQCYNAEVA